MTTPNGVLPWPERGLKLSELRYQRALAAAWEARARALHAALKHYEAFAVERDGEWKMVAQEAINAIGPLPDLPDLPGEGE